MPPPPPLKKKNDKILTSDKASNNNPFFYCLNVLKATITLCDLSAAILFIPAHSCLKRFHSRIVHSLRSGKVEMFLCAACHAFTPHVNAWKRLIGIVVQV